MAPYNLVMDTDSFRFAIAAGSQIFLEQCLQLLRCPPYGRGKLLTFFVLLCISFQPYSGIGSHAPWHFNFLYLANKWGVLFFAWCHRQGTIFHDSFLLSFLFLVDGKLLKCS